jgi:hypothetical protein
MDPVDIFLFAAWARKGMRPKRVNETRLT